MTTLPIKSDDRPVSMLELTINLNDIDFEGENDTPAQTPTVEEEVIQPESMEGRNLESTPSTDDVDGSGSGEHAPITVVLSMQQLQEQPEDEEKTERHRKLEKTLSGSSYTEVLANNILKESVEKLDPMVFVTRMNEESLVFLSILNCTIRVSFFHRCFLVLFFITVVVYGLINHCKLM